MYGKRSWHCRETRRQTEKTNLNLWYLEKPVYSTQFNLFFKKLFGVRRGQLHKFMPPMSHYESFKRIGAY